MNECGCPKKTGFHGALASRLASPRSDSNMSILSVDLASNRYRDIGVAILEFRDGSVLIEFVEASAYGLKGRPCVEDATSWLTDLASAHEANVIFIDGPTRLEGPYERF